MPHDASVSSPAAAQPGVRRRWTAGRILAALVLTVTLLLIVADLGLRFILGLGTPVMVQRDSAAEYVLVPNQHRVRFRVRTDVNEWSMRSPSFAMPKPADVYRIMMIGDSMTYGTTRVGQSAIFSSELAAELPGKLHRKIEVLNASAGGWGIGNELGYLKSRGTFDSDLVVLVPNSADLSSATATFSDVGGDTPTNKPMCALCELWDRFLKEKILQLKPKADAGTNTTTGSVAQDIANAKDNLKNLDEFYSIVQAHHARMAIVFLAMRMYLPDNGKVGAQQAMIDWAAAHHVPLVDVTPAETSHPTAAITLDGVHMNSAGHRIVADYLEQHWNEVDPALTAPDTAH